MDEIRSSIILIRTGFSDSPEFKKKRRGKRILMEPFLRLNPSLNALLQPQHVNDF
jgi:hypothetical protein